MFNQFETIDFREFVSGQYEKKSWLKRTVATETVLYGSTAPQFAFAATGDETFSRIIDAIMNVTDYLSIGCIIFVGTLWMFGHRSKALDMLIGVAIGTIIINHALDIHRFLTGI